MLHFIGVSPWHNYDGNVLRESMKTQTHCRVSRAFVIDFESFLIHAFMESTTYHPGINITLVPKVLAKLKTKCTIALPW